MNTPQESGGRLWAAIVTYRRPDLLDRMVARVLAQTKQPDEWVLVDNGSDPWARSAAERVGAAYLETGHNAGPAGGIALAMRHVLAGADPNDWLLLLDDNDLPPWPDTIERLWTFGHRMLAEDERTGAVGIRGARYNRNTGLYRRLEDHELVGAVSLDGIHGGWFPLYRVAALTEAGVFDETLWFGFEEGEFGLRLRSHSFSIYGDGERWLHARRSANELGIAAGTSRTPIGAPAWRRYYSTRNATVLARRYGKPWTPPLVALGGAARGARALLRGKRPLAEVMLPVLGALDGLRGRLGRVVDPPAPALAMEPTTTKAAVLVSLVVPAFNVAPYLEECLDSLVSQTHSTLDIIVVDDGSTDGTGAIADRYAAADPRVTVIHRQNQGVSAARNAGLDGAQGDLLSFVDADDWLDPAFVEHLAALLQATGADIAMSGLLSASQQHQGPSTHERVTLSSAHDLLNVFDGPDHTVLTVPTAKLYRRTVLNAIRFPVGLRYEDEFTTYRAFMNAQRVVQTTLKLYGYRQHAASTMHATETPDRLRDIVAAYRERVEVFRQAGLVRGHALASGQLYRKYVKLYRLLPSSDLAARYGVLRELRNVTRQLRTTKQPLLFRLFSELYSASPALMDRAYSRYLANRPASRIVTSPEAGEHRPLDDRGTSEEDSESTRRDS